MEKRDAFLCHAGDDKEQFVRPLAEELRLNAITYWLDEAEIKWGESITQKVSAGLGNSRFVIAFFTPAMYQRNFPEAELYSSLNREIADNTTLILPILAMESATFKARYPLLAAKRYMEWQAGPKRIAAELLKSLNRDYRARWTWIYPERHKGQVWFRVAAAPAEKATPHDITISWGPWTYRCRLSLEGGAIALIHSKSHDGEPVPISLEVTPKAYSDFGIDSPPEGRTMDINRGWTRK